MTDSRDILTLEEFLPYRLSVLSNLVSASIADMYAARFGLNIPSWRVMAILGRFPGISAAEVAERGALDKVAVSRAVSQLLLDGRIVRTIADDDRRRSVLCLSPEGWKVYDTVVPLAREYEARLVDGLSVEDQAALDRLISKLNARATKMSSPD